MRQKIATLAAGAFLVTLCSGASCRQETAQSVLATFLNTIAETAAQQIVSDTAKSIDVDGHADSNSEGWQ